jgi:site-specific DNA-methyltransferase (adenine-specific)
VSATPRNRVLVGDALLRLQALPDASVDCVVTSPPYFGLRNYGVPGQLGAEADVGLWVARLRAVMSQLARVLRPTGTVWLNLGDSYSQGAHWGAPAKSLLLAPERLLLELQRDGWIVRNKIVWSKANPMPTSSRDRLACTWEPVYLLTRQGRYHFDLDAIRQPHRSRVKARGQPLTRPERAAWAGPLAGDQYGLDALKGRGLVGHPLGKNPGDVWRLATSNYRGGHHATFPERLVEPCLLAGCPTWTCMACGRAWRRREPQRQLGSLALMGQFEPACGCRADRRPGLVLDPFIGSGTVAVVAERLERDWLGIELNIGFARQAMQRVAAARANRPPAADNPSEDAAND